MHQITILDDSLDSCVEVLAALEGYVVHTFSNLDDLLASPNLSDTTLFLIDIHLGPSMKGGNALVHIRNKIKNDIDACFMTGENFPLTMSEHHSVRALDFIYKYASRLEIRARIDHCIKKIRREYKVGKSLFYVGELTVSLDGRLMDLTMLELKILKALFFYDAHIKPCLKSLIIEMVWSGAYVEDKTPRVHIYNLNKKLEASDLKIRISRSGEISIDEGDCSS